MMEVEVDNVDVAAKSASSSLRRVVGDLSGGPTVGAGAAALLGERPEPAIEGRFGRTEFESSSSKYDRRNTMEYRRLGCSGLKVSAVTMGTMTFGGVGWAKKTGDLGVSEAKRLVDLCRDAAVNLIDTADVYSGGVCEEIIGEILGGKRKGGVLLATKARFRMGEGPNDLGCSRQHLIAACEASLR